MSNLTTNHKDMKLLMRSKQHLSKALLKAPILTLKEEGRVYFINKKQQIEECQSRLQKAIVIGLDTETKPEFKKKSKCNPTSLLQIAMRDRDGIEDVYIFDLIALSSKDYNEMIMELFLDTKILKIGQSLLNDLQVPSTFLSRSQLMQELSQHYPTATCFKRMNSVIEANALFRELEGSSYPMLSLQKLVYYSLGSKLLKTCQTSNWNRRPLSPNQMTYAALDALALIWIHDDLTMKINQANSIFNIKTHSRAIDVNRAEVFKCEICNYTLNSDQGYYNHTSTCTGVKETKKIQCALCPRKFSSESALHSHIQHCRAKNNVPIDLPKQEPCYCGRSIGASHQSHSLHQICASYKIFSSTKEDGSITWCCVDCKKSFESPEQLLYHHGLCKEEDQLSVKHVRFSLESSSRKRKNPSGEDKVDERSRFQRTASEDFTDSAEEVELWSEVSKCGTEIQS